MSNTVVSHQVPRAGEDARAPKSRSPIAIKSTLSAGYRLNDFNQSHGGVEDYYQLKTSTDRLLGSGPMMQSPYSIYNLRRNPFGELTRSERAELAVVDELDEWIQALNDAQTAIQFVGDCGFGKTTHLLAIEKRLPHAAYIYYPETGPRPALPRERPVLVDEADRMGWRQHMRLLRGGGPIVIGTHVDYSWRLRLAGFQVLNVNVEIPKEPSMLAKILNRRIEASRLAEGLPVPHVDVDFADQLLRQFDSNLRRIEHFLYERFQLSISEQTPWPPAI